MSALLMRHLRVATLCALTLAAWPMAVAAQSVSAPSNATALAGNEDESAVAVNPNNPLQIAVMTNGIPGDAGLPLSFSSDGGVTWTRTSFATGSSADGGPAACCDPTLAWDDHGNLFVGYLQRTPRTIELFVTTDLGATWTNLGPVDSSSGSQLDQPTVAAGANSVWVTWRDDSGGISARGRSVTGAGTFGAWGPEQDVSTVGNFGDIAIGPAGQVMVVYQTPTGGQGPSTMIVHTDPDGLGAGGFGAGVTVGVTNVGGFDFLPAQPSRSVDAETGLAWDRSGGPRDGRVYLVYTDENPNESNDFDIWVRWSTDNGANWSAPVRVNDDVGTNSQMLPRIALDQASGNVAVSWYDARNDTGGGPNATDLDGTANNDVTLFASWSTNGGGTWAANVAIADAPTSGYVAALGGQQLGDYTGLAFHGGVFYPTWADNSNSTGDNPGGTRSTLDVYAARVDVGNQPPTVTVAAAAGIEGAAIVLSGSANDPNGDVLTLSWEVTALSADAGASCTVTTGASTTSPTIRCSDDGTFTATLTATGDPAGPVSASATVTVSNVAPTPTSAATTPAIIDEGQATAFSSTFADPGWNDTYTGSISWGFGAAESVTPVVTTAGAPGLPDVATLAAAHTYMDDGAFVVTGSVSDDDAGTAAVAVAVTVRNVAPTAVIDKTDATLVNGVQTIFSTAGSPVPFSGRSTDPGSDDLTLTWNWDDGPPAPDVTVVSLHAPPNADADPSPFGVSRDVTDGRSHTFADACSYGVRFASSDDDGGSGSDLLTVVVVGRFTDTRSMGYWKNELATPRSHTTAGIQCLLKIAGFMSAVFDERRDASTVAAAVAVMSTSGSSAANDLLDAQLLAAWLNFADGRVGLTDLVDLDQDGVGDITFAALVAQAEAVRLDPNATRAQLLEQKTRLDIFNNSRM